MIDRLNVFDVRSSGNSARLHVITSLPSTVDPKSARVGQYAVSVHLSELKASFVDFAVIPGEGRVGIVHLSELEFSVILAIGSA